MSCDLLIIGGDGDLALRKLYPALYSLWKSGRLPADMRVLAIARRELSQADFLEQVRTWFDRSKSASQYSPTDWESFCSRIEYCRQDATSSEGMASLAEIHLSDSERDIVVYLATPPQIFAPICRALDTAGLVRPNTRIVVEKPLGESRETFLEINDQLTSIFEEDQVYRIDHYLGKETVQNLLALRFANTFLEPLWNNKYIDNVQITVAESIGVSGRWDFYDAAGAMRDMVQNHLLQLLCLAAMEPPARLASTAVRNEKLKVLSCLRPMDKKMVRENTVIGQYTAGAVDGEAVPGYGEEEGAKPGSETETFVALKTYLDNWRWAGVPFYLRTGKRLQHRYSEIVVEFKQVAHSIFGAQLPAGTPNRMIIRLQPDETISLELMNKVAGLDANAPLRKVTLDLTFPEDSAIGPKPNAYQRLLLDVVRNNSTLFVRADEVEEAWKWVDCIQSVWEEAGKRAERYTAGSDGPSQAIALIARDGRNWHEYH
ncbi:MAG: glucose-6-phosphate dehydrogenase [Halioglobus sp.]|nr:glucose-6-phosphate dehydrogenase [Halioglobus sp.]